jgi:hypothetical protein
MKTKRRKEEIAASLKLLASTYVQAVRQLEDTLAILCRELDLQETSWLENVLALEPVASPAASAFRPVADRTTLSVLFQGKTCFLGNTLLFRFFEVISRRPNLYISHDQLLDEVWGGIRSESTIRNVANDFVTSWCLSTWVKSQLPSTAALRATTCSCAYGG